MSHRIYIKCDFKGCNEYADAQVRESIEGEIPKAGWRILYIHIRRHYLAPDRIELCPKHAAMIEIPEEEKQDGNP